MELKNLKKNELVGIISNMKKEDITDMINNYAVKNSKKVFNKKNSKYKNFKLFWNILNQFRFPIVCIAL